MLNFAAQIADRSNIVNGKATTTAGLTASVNKDGDNSLEAGALVLSD